MLLLIDIGNSDITTGLSDSNEVLGTLRTKTNNLRNVSVSYREALDSLTGDYNVNVIEGAALCSVVEKVTPDVINTVRDRFNIDPLIVDHTVNSGLKFKIKNIHMLGTDRIASAAAARCLYDGNLIVVDFGTATTFSTITEEADYIGGAIMPGIGMSAAALNEKTSALPLVDLRAPENIPGKDTADNILTGIIIGHAGAVERIIYEIGKETKKTFSVIVTGGYSGLVSPFIKGINYINPSLTLDGLRILYKLNS